MVKSHLEGLQVQVLFAAQIGHGEVADIVEIVHIAIGGEAAVVGRHGFLRQKIPRDVGNVVAVVGVFGPSVVAWRQPLSAALGGHGQGVNLHTGIVVIELAVHRPTLGIEQVANRVAQGGLPAMAHMQRAGGVG